MKKLPAVLCLLMLTGCFTAAKQVFYTAVGPQGQYLLLKPAAATGQMNRYKAVEVVDFVNDIPSAIKVNVARAVQREIVKRLTDAPEYPIRGHQLGYRGLNNTYDTWDLATYEQYVRDLIIFGTNAIELIPTFDPTKKSGPHMKKPMWQMNRALSEMAGSFYLG